MKTKGPEKRFNLVYRRTIDKLCDGPYEDGGDCGMHASVTVHGPDIPMRNLCSFCFFEFVFHFGYCDAVVTVIP